MSTCDYAWPDLQFAHLPFSWSLKGNSHSLFFEVRDRVRVLCQVADGGNYIALQLSVAFFASHTFPSRGFCATTPVRVLLPVLCSFCRADAHTRRFSSIFFAAGHVKSVDLRLPRLETHESASLIWDDRTPSLMSKSTAHSPRRGVSC